MLDCTELSFSDDCVELFEYMQDIWYPDDPWRTDKIITEQGWEYRHENTEDDFILCLNYLHQLLHTASKYKWDIWVGNK